MSQTNLEVFATQTSAPDPRSRPSDGKEHIAAANHFFGLLFPQIQAIQDEGLVNKIEFGMHSSDFFLLGFAIPREKIPNRQAVREFDMIINVRSSSQSAIEFELIGHSIVSANVEEFARLTCNEIKMIVQRQISVETVSKP